MREVRKSDSPPPKGATATTTVTGGWRGVKEDVEEPMVNHQIYLAVDRAVSIVTVKKEYKQRDNKVYYYNAATLSISVSKSDQRMYPEICEPLKKGSGNPTLQIDFNGPRGEWEPGLTGQGEGERATRGIRVQVKLPDFLKNLNSGNRSGVTVHLDGFVYRENFRRGRPTCLTLDVDDNMLALDVDKLGETTDLGIPMCPGLFGNFDNLKGVFTVKVTWLGPDANAKYDLVPLFRMLLEESAPKKEKRSEIQNDSSSSTALRQGEERIGTEEVAAAGEKGTGTEKAVASGEVNLIDLDS